MTSSPEVRVETLKVVDVGRGENPLLKYKLIKVGGWKRNEFNTRN